VRAALGEAEVVLQGRHGDTDHGSSMSIMKMPADAAPRIHHLR
jgi:hypothetical protein